MTSLSRLLLTIAASTAVAARAPSLALAQASTDTRTFKPSARASDALVLGAAGAGAAALMRYDREIGDWFRQPRFQHSGEWRGTMTGARLFGDPGAIVIGAGLWAGGALSHDQTTSIDGLRSLEAITVASAVTWAVKGIAGRARPYADSTNSHDWRLGRGFGGNGQYQSFPSGHTTAAFAFAAAMTARVAQRSTAEAQWMGPLLYGAAALTGASRIYDQKHWASDVLLGAAIGTVGGLVVVRSHGR